MNIQDVETGFASFDDERKRTFVDGGDYTMEHYSVKDVFGDAIMAEVIDTVEGGMIVRNGLHIPVNNTQSEYLRFLRVYKKGPKVSDKIEEGTIIVMPAASVNGRQGIVKDKKRYIFIPESYVMFTAERS